MKKLNYGIDAPGVIRNLFLFSIVFFAIALLYPVINIGGGKVIINMYSTGMIGGTICFLQGLMMLLYAKVGKFRHRDRMLNLIKWTGNETVLDIGTGRGLLMNGAAKRLSSGKAIGIDIWNKEDLSNNSLDQTKLNAELEGVANKIDIKNENILNTGFTDNYFDVIVSNLCIHNIYDTEGRNTACKEIYRILKQNGTAIISDFKHTSQYKAEFEKLGMTTQKIGTYYFDTFPPLTIITAVKTR